MNSFKRVIWEDGEYDYAAAYGFVPNIKAYLHEDGEIRDCMMVVPGGGYCMVVPPEGEHIAKEFYNRGMNCFVLTYTTDITMSVPLREQPFKDASRAIRYIRANSEEFKINPDRLFISGFSAGGHVCGMVCTHYEDLKDENHKYKDVSNRPTAAILGYPVITAGEYTHLYSIQALLGKNPTAEELDYYSVEKNVTKDTPPCFLWQTVTDDLVPVENTYLMAESLRKNGVLYAQYAFPRGFHGLSLPNKEFFEGMFGDPYTFEQVNQAIEHVRNYTAVNVSQERHDELMIQFFGNKEGKEIQGEEKTPPASPKYPEGMFDDILLWPELATVFLKFL